VATNDDDRLAGTVVVDLITRVAHPRRLGPPAPRHSSRSPKAGWKALRLIQSRKDALQQFEAALEDRFGGTATSASSGNDEAEARPLGELLVEQGNVSVDELQHALLEQTANGGRLGETLVQLGVIDEQTLAAALAAQAHLPVIVLPRVDIDPDTATLLPEPLARELCAITFGRDGERVDVAVGEPFADDLQARLIAELEAPVRMHVAARSDVVHAIDHSFVDHTEFDDALRDFQERFAARRADTAQTQVAVDENAPVVKVVTLVLEQAVRDRASDVHIEPQEDRVRIRVRTDGALHEVMSLPQSMATPLVSRIKVMADMNIVERRRPQDGQMETEVAGRELDVRVSTSPTIYGEKCVLRLLDKTRAFLDLAGLGMADDTAATYRDLIRSPYGMVICAGPTGSGKTTTLYATLAAINDDSINVTTIEDPVEYVFPTINQIQINEQAGVTFAGGLRSILRQDPDAILVGEIRDVETARIAVQAALTGHFVMSSLHATDATSALHRFMDMGIEPFLISSSLLGIVGQRLVRKVCSRCAETYTPTTDELAFFERSGGDLETATFVHGAGCTFCGHTGYYERVGIYEVLPLTDALKELVVSNASIADLRATAMADGFRTLRDQAIRLVEDGRTTVAEVLRTVYVL
jgi:type IV pilus assembly protein PilB